MKYDRLFWGLVIFLSLFILLSAFYHLEDSPKPWFDEGYYIHIAKILADKGVYAFQITPNTYGEMDYISVGFPVLYPLAGVYKVFGASILSSRIFSVFWVFGFLLVSFFYVKHSAGKWFGLASVALLATFSPLYGNGKNVLGEIPGLFFVIFSLWMFNVARKTDWQAKFLVLSGLSAGMAAATKPTFIPFLGLMAVFGTIMLLRQKISAKSYIIFAAAAAFPLTAWLLTQFNQVTDWQSAIGHYANPYNELHPWDNLSANLIRFISESTPIHFAFFLVLCSSFLYLRRKKADGVVWVVFLFSVIVWFSYLKSPGWYRYFFPAHVLLILTLPLLVSMFDFVRWRKALILFFISLVTFQGYHTLTHLDQMHDPSWREVKKLVVERNGQSPILFHNVPEGAFFSDHNNYYQYISIRPGLIYGEDNLKNTDIFDMIVTRDGEEDLSLIRKTAPSFKLSSHIGNYHIFTK